MKEKQVALSVEKILERKRNIMKEVKSTLLPLISQTSKNIFNGEGLSSEFLGSRNNQRYPDSSTLTSDQLRNGRL